MSWYNKYYHLQPCLKTFGKIHAKMIKPNDFSNLQKYVAKSLCLLDLWFPPTFFDLMIYLLSHLIDELKICRPVDARWCYLVEKYLNVLKRYVRNMA
jgi:hypothetical protein